MTSIIDGRYYPSDVENIVDAMTQYHQELREGELEGGNRSILRDFYRADAKLHNRMQQDMAELLDSTRLRYAEGKALNLVTEHIGVTREPAYPATGSQQFFLNTAAESKVPIPKGTVVRTAENSEWKEYRTTEYAEVPAGETDTMVPIQAIKPGTQSNVGPNAIDTFKGAPPRNSDDQTVETTNPNPISGGQPKESDEDLRERARKGGSEYARSTQGSIVEAVARLKKCNAVKMYVNDTPDDNGRGYGLPAWHSEVIAQYDGDEQDVIDVLGEYRGAGTPLTAGYNGTAVSGQYLLENNQWVSYQFSEPQETAMYVNVEVTTNEDYAGDEYMANELVQYLGGIKVDGSYYSKGLAMGEDVIYNKVLGVIIRTPGVEDVVSLEIGPTDPPTNTDNYTIGETEIATLDARESSGFITVTKN